MVSHGRVKGAAIRDFISWHIQTHGREPLERAVRRLPVEAQQEFDLESTRLGVLSNVWFPSEVVHGVLDELTAGLDETAYEALVQGAAEATVRGLLTGVQKVIFRTFMTPGAYAKVANLAFRLNYGDGEVKNEVLGPNRHFGRVEGWRAHHPFLCRMNVAVKAGIYRAMGCENVRIEERQCRASGGKYCGSIIAWG